MHRLIKAKPGLLVAPNASHAEEETVQTTTTPHAEEETLRTNCRFSLSLRSAPSLFLSPSAIGACYGYILSPLLRLVPATGRAPARWRCDG
eukprot:170794-Prorocentrum_minimum.AAC.4